MKEIELLGNYRSLINSHLSRLFSLIADENVRAICEKHDLTIEKRRVDIGFNLFTIISDIYHQENFHSDILQVILDPKGKHNEGDKYLILFLRFIKLFGANIKLSDYNNAIVFREKGKIDILIEDQSSKKAIIIENKINNARDMDRQLPRYLEYVISKGCRCDAIIYLRLNQKKEPDTYNWTEDDKKEVQKLLVKINAYDETENDLLNGWINIAEKQSSHIDALLILRQYGALIKHLGGNVMNKQTMDEFYKEMLIGENYKTALSLKSMIDDLILYRVVNLIDKFEQNPKPLVNIKNYQNWCAYFSNVIIDSIEVQVAIWVLVDKYYISLRHWNEGDPSYSAIKKLLEKMDILDDFSEYKEGFKKDFKFPEQEQEMFEYIQKLNNKLAEVLQNLNPIQSVLN